MSCDCQLIIKENDDDDDDAQSFSEPFTENSFYDCLWLNYLTLCEGLDLGLDQKRLGRLRKFLKSWSCSCKNLILHICDSYS